MPSIRRQGITKTNPDPLQIGPPEEHNTMNQILEMYPQNKVHMRVVCTIQLILFMFWSVD